jgi:large subunit ribosomal protein L10
MPLTRAEKEAVIAGYRDSIAHAAHAFLVDYRGVSVPQVTELRSKIRAIGGDYLVVKNRLALRAIEGAALEELKEHFRGTVAVAFTNQDPVALAKALSDFSADVPAIGFKAGLVDGQVVAPGQIEEIAKLPSREELVAKLLFLLQSPISRFVRALGAIPQKLVIVLDQVAKAKQQG